MMYTENLHMFNLSCFLSPHQNFEKAKEKKILNSSFLKEMTMEQSLL